jgi:predicted ATP-dependent serine protease
MTAPTHARQPSAQLSKALTGIQGLDEVTRGGLPRGRPTLVCGGAGSGKTLFGLEFLVRGATRYNEPGVFISFEETIIRQSIAQSALLEAELLQDRGHRQRSRDGVGPSPVRGTRPRQARAR